MIRQSPKARQAKSKARISKFDDLVDDARKKRGLARRRSSLPPAPAWAVLVIEAENLSKPTAIACLFREPVVQAAARRHRRRHRRQRRGQVHDCSAFIPARNSRMPETSASATR
jgi:hypothetical protein